MKFPNQLFFVINNYLRTQELSGLLAEGVEPEEVSRALTEALLTQVYGIVWQPHREPGYYVNVYNVSRAVGGPEEGGWYYDHGTPVCSIRCHDEQEWDAAAEAAKGWFAPYNATRIMKENYPAEDFPKHRPRYE